MRQNSKLNTVWRMDAAGIGFCLPLTGMGVLLAIKTQPIDNSWQAWLAAAALSVIIYYAALRMIKPALSAPHVIGVLCVLCLIVTLTAAALCLNAAISFWTSWTMPRTPFLFYAALSAITCGYGASRGASALRGMSVIIAVLFIVVGLLDTILLLPEMEPTRLSWTYDKQIIGSAAGILLWLLLPLPAITVLFSADEEKATMDRRPFVVGLAVCGGYLLLVSVRNIFMLGELATLDQYPILRTLKLVQAGIGLSRVEFLGIFMLMLASLFGVMCLINTAARCLRHLSGRTLRWCSWFCVLSLYLIMLAFWGE